MIVRIWHGWTRRSDAGAYQQLLDTEILPGILARNIAGLDAIDVLRRDTGGDEVEFITSMTFEDWPAVQEFAGNHSTTAVVPESAQKLLSHYDGESQHYELVAHHDASEGLGWTS